VVKYEGCHWSLLAQDVKEALQTEQGAAVAQKVELDDVAAFFDFVGLLIGSMVGAWYVGGAVKGGAHLGGAL